MQVFAFVATLLMLLVDGVLCAFITNFQVIISDYCMVMLVFSSKPVALIPPQATTFTLQFFILLLVDEALCI